MSRPRKIPTILLALGLLSACKAIAPKANAPGPGRSPSSLEDAELAEKEESSSPSKASHTADATEKLFQSRDLSYLGAMRLPQDSGGPSRFSYGGSAIAFRPSGNAGKGSLYVVGHDHHQLVAEVSLPKPVVSKNWNALPTATLLHDFVDISGGLKASNPDPKVGGLLVAGSNLLWSFYTFYNVSGDHFSHLGVSRDDLSNLQARGMWSLDGVHMQKTAGYIAEIPQAWRARFGFPYLVGLSRPQGRATTSEGPAAFGYRPFSSGAWPEDDDSLSTKTFLAHEVGHPVTYTLGGTERVWKGSDNFNGMIFLHSEDGRKSAVVAAMRLGTHPEDYYGLPEGYPGPACGGGSGYHGGPYRTELWFYDPEKLLEVSQGKLSSWAPRPYLRFSLSSKWLTGDCKYLGGIAYDSQTRRIFIAEPEADATNEYESQPIIHTFQHP